MRRRSSRRRRSRRNVAPNRRRRSRRLRANVFGQDLITSVLVPVAGGTAGFLATRYLGNLAAMKDWGSDNPKVTKAVAAVALIGVGIPMALRFPIVARNSAAIMLGVGMAPVEAWLRDTPLLGGSPAAAALTEDLPPTPPPGNGEGVASYYDYPVNRYGQAATTITPAMSGLASYYDYPVDASGQASAALSDDFYSAQMLGNTADPADQSAVETALDMMEGRPQPVSTVEPTGMALPARNFPQTRNVRERFANRGDRGHAGGIFARTLFSGMMGS